MDYDMNWSEMKHVARRLGEWINDPSIAIA